MKTNISFFSMAASPIVPRPIHCGPASAQRRVKLSAGLLLLLAAARGLLLADPVQVQLIDVDFNTNSAHVSGGGPAIGPTMSGAAVLGGADDHWNGIDVTSGTGIPLIYANGSNSPVTMTFTSGGGYDANSYGGSTPFASTPMDAMMEDYLYNGGVAQTVTLSGLAPYAKYDLVLYSAADAYGAGRTTYFMVNSNQQSSTWNGSSGALVAGVDYVEFSSAVSDHSGNLAITWSGNGSQEADLNGFQIKLKPAQTAPGLDATFAGSGKTMISFGDAAGAAYALAIQTDGKIVVAGQTNNGAGLSALALARLNTDGSPDLSFGTNGRVTTTAMANAAAVAVQTDGKIVAAGGYGPFEVARYNTDGSLDASFGTNGITSTSLAQQAQAVKIEADGKIVVAGFGADSGGRNQFAVARFATNGVLDPSFGSGGLIITTFGTPPSAALAYGLGIAQDGKIVAGGLAAAEVGSTVVSDLAAARYNANGALDFSFGSLGRTQANVGGSTLDAGYAMAIQPDGKIVVAGGAGIGDIPGPAENWDNVSAFVALARFDTNGTPDSTFGNNGTVVAEVGAYSDLALALALQPDGKILVAGASKNGDYQWFVQRYTANGAPDPTYGDASVRFVNFGSGTNEIAYALALDSTGRAVVAGDAGGLFGVARLLPNAVTLPVSLKISLTATNTALVSWPYPSAGWNLQQTADLTTNNWVTPPETINNDGTNNFIVVNPRSNNLFFRLTQ
jgi:uncharacterized delta-60 repeat protein